MITDISGTAYTYAFLTKKPIIFFLINEKLINELGYNELSYLQDRKKIGTIAQSLDHVREAVRNIKFIESKTKISNDLLEKEINYLGNSKNRIKQLINVILSEK